MGANNRPNDFPFSEFGRLDKAVYVNRVFVDCILCTVNTNVLTIKYLTIMRV